MSHSFKNELRCLLLDTGFSSEPIYDALKSHAKEILVVGNRPSDLLAQRADKYINQDYSDTSAIRDVIRENQIDKLCPGCTDLSYEVCSAFFEEEELII